MILYYSNKTRAYVPFGNFGDELNGWLWEKFLPNVFDEEDSNTVFVGFGTILNNNLPKFRKTIIFGTGYGFGDPPEIDESWKIYCVRGPKTAKTLKLPVELGIADPAILANRVYPFSAQPKIHEVSLIPYVFEMNDSPETFQEVCQNLNFFCIDPRWNVEKVMEEISRSKLVITAAMHGAIIADAFRVPWIPFKSNAGIPDFKWIDFCDSLEVIYPINRFRRLARLSRFSSVFSKIEVIRMTHYLERLVYKSESRLSKDNLLNLKLDQLQDKLELFKRDFGYT